MFLTGMHVPVDFPSCVSRDPALPFLTADLTATAASLEGKDDR
jgi:hypothetical protein